MHALIKLPVIIIEVTVEAIALFCSLLVGLVEMGLE